MFLALLVTKSALFPEPSVVPFVFLEDKQDKFGTFRKLPVIA